MERRQKYPRTLHLPWSPGATSDDKRLCSLDHFEGKEVVVTEKMDGENTTLYRDGLHARSLDSRHHPSRDWVKGFQAGLAWALPSGMRVCGENLFARHSIPYDALDSFFLGFSVWRENTCLSWDDTMDWFEKLGISPVPVLDRGIFDSKRLQKLHSGESPTSEGYVVRLATAFELEDFAQSVAKFVRENHVQTDQHWAHSMIIPNALKNA